MSARKKPGTILERSATMGALRDADRVVALVRMVESLAEGKSMALGEIASAVFGWETERVFLAIDAALAAGMIGKNAPDGRIHVARAVLPEPRKGTSGT